MHSKIIVIAKPIAGFVRLAWVLNLFQDGNLIRVHQYLDLYSKSNEIAAGFGQPTNH